MTLRSVRLFKFRFTFKENCSIINPMKSLNISRQLNKHLPLLSGWTCTRPEINVSYAFDRGGFGK
jgi:hypothetical protein